MRWTIEEVAGALGIAPPAGIEPVARLAGVSIDSRSVGRGELFVAIRGPRYDGHDFVRAALEAGAAAAVVNGETLSKYSPEIRERLLGVGDTVAALQDLARAVRRKWGLRIAAVTGSVGKTTTKELLAALLGAKFRVLKSEGNLNNEYGLPLTLLKLEAEHEAAVVELGMSHRGELRRLAEIAEPELGVVTRVAPVHLEFFQSVDEIALAKRELIEGLAGSESVAVLNADDPRVARFAEVAPGRVLTYGVTEKADFQGHGLEDRGVAGSSFDVTSPAGRTHITLPLPGRHNVGNALAAMAAASVWGITAADAAEVFLNMKAGEMRGRLLQFGAGFAVINDSYNSNPVALRAMVDVLAGTTGYKRRILAAGEMLELGPDSPQLHREVGRYAASRQVDWVIAVRGDAAELAAGAIEGGVAPERVRFFGDSAEAANFVPGIMEAGDLLLVKGSRGVKMERVFEALKSKYALAEDAAAAPAADPATVLGAGRREG